MSPAFMSTAFELSASFATAVSSALTTLLATAPLGGSGATDGADEAGLTILQQIQNGGLTGYIIIGLSIVTLALVIVNWVAIRPERLVPPDVAELLRSALERRSVDDALAICRDPNNDSFLTRVLERGLTRYQRSAFGAFELKEALEEAGGEQVARLYRATEPIGLIGAIAPMLGLLGTVIGMVGAFDTISNADARPELLAGDISKALVTTLMGLILAIPTMAAFTYLRNRIDTCATEAARAIEDLTLPLEMSSGGNQSAAAAAGSAGPGPGPGRMLGNRGGSAGGSGGGGTGGMTQNPGATAAAASGGGTAAGTRLTGAARRR